MANNNKHTGPNVPALRFPEFSGEWETLQLADLASFSKDRVKIETLSIDNYVSTENMQQDFAGIKEAISLPSSSTAVEFQIGDILISNIRPYLRKIWLADRNGGCSADVLSLRTRNEKMDSTFLYCCLANDGFISYVMSGAKGVKMPRGDKQHISSFSFGVPSIKEQKKISKLISLLEKRISTQSKIIEELKTLRSALRHKLLHEMLIERTAKLGTLCRIATGKLDANAMVEGGNYPFFTCAEQVYEIDRYAFDTEALLISGNGANLGYINYYYGKFNAYQRTYVLSDFSEDIQYLRQYLEANLSKRIESEKNTGNTPYIVLGTLADMEIELPSKPVQKTIANELGMLSLKLEYETHYLSLLMKEKVALLNRMFI